MILFGIAKWNLQVNPRPTSGRLTVSTIMLFRRLKQNSFISRAAAVSWKHHELVADLFYDMLALAYLFAVARFPLVALVNAFFMRLMEIRISIAFVREQWKKRFTRDRWPKRLCLSELSTSINWIVISRQPTCRNCIPLNRTNSMTLTLLSVPYLLCQRSVDGFL